MGELKLLDCTLRDGGYVNDWEFGHNNLVSIFERLVDANVDVIEVGFLDDRRPFDINRSIMPDTDCMEKIYGGLEPQAGDGSRNDRLWYLQAGEYQTMRGVFFRWYPCDF